MTVFKEKDIENLKKWGNKKAKSYWMASYSKTLYPCPGAKDKERMKEFLKAKYVEKRFVEKEENDSSSSDERKEDSDDASPDKPKKIVLKHKKKH